MDNHMAREMTPQERAAELAEQISGAHHQLAYPGATVRSLVFDALQQTRRAALLEAIKCLDDTAHEGPDVGYVALTKLAQEGA